MPILSVFCAFGVYKHWNVCELHILSSTIRMDKISLKIASKYTTILVANTDKSKNGLFGHKNAKKVQNAPKKNQKWFKKGPICIR